MSVESFDPSRGATAERLTPAQLTRLQQAAQQLDVPDFGLSELEVRSLAGVARGGAAVWSGPAAELDSAALEALIRLFTLAEPRLPGWEAGARSPVVPLVKELRDREAFGSDLNRWIKSNTENRFLPYGSLLDRL